MSQLTADRHLAGCVASIVAACIGARPPGKIVWPRDVFRATRGDEVEAWARQVAAYLIVTRFGVKMKAAAEAIGRDRTTVSHACKVVGDWAEADDTGGADAWLSELGDICERAWSLRSAQIALERDGAETSSSR